MRVLYLDCFSGISGDMTLGALLDLGLDSNLFLTELSKLKVDGYHVEIKKVVKSGITGTDVNVVLDDEHSHEHDHSHEHGHSHEHDHSHEHGHSHEHDHSHEHGHSHEHEHSHEHGHSHEHEHSHEHGHSREHEHHRNLKDIEQIISQSDLRPRVKALATKIFREIAKAEAKVHNKTMNEVHFHEVGAIDSIVDIVGAAICIDMLGVEKVYASELHEGKGFVKCAHGILPVPVPAVLEMLVDSNIPLVTENIPYELVTPTGIGILKSIASTYGKMPAMVIERTGYGMGKRETGRLNALRAVVGKLYEQDMIPNEDISILETNIDNMSSEVLGYTMEKLLENGALDVFYTPIYMKKNRPAVMLTTLCKAGEEKKFSDIIFKETSTLGIRYNKMSRFCMNRDIINVDTALGAVRVKVSNIGDIKKYAPEYEDCRTIAKNTGLPLNKVYEIVNQNFSNNNAKLF